MMEKKGVIDLIKETKLEYRNKAKNKIAELKQIHPKVRSLLHSLTDYCYLRNS